MSSFGFKLGPQFGGVENLPIKHQNKRAFSVHHGLVSLLQIHDRQTPHRQTYGICPSKILPSIIGAPMDKCVI